MTKLEKEAKERSKDYTENKERQIAYECGFLDGADTLEKENERITTKYYELQETLKKVRVALIKERTANIMNYGKGGVEMFDDMFEILKGVSN